MLSRSFGESPETPIPPLGSISFDVAILTRYFDIWLIFVSEIASVLIAANYTPMLQRFHDTFKVYVSSLSEGESLQRPTIIGILILFMSTHFHLDSSLLSPSPYKVQPYEPFSASRDIREEACVILRDLLNTRDWDDQIAFSVIQNVNFTLYPQILNTLSLVRVDQLPDATETVAIMLRSPYVTSSFFHSLLLQLFSYLAVVQSQFISYGINSPRVIEWTEKAEEETAKYSAMIKHYCCINSLYFTRNAGQISEEVWSISCTG